MRIALLTHGTRGDIQPYVVLASALQEAGFTVTLAAPPNLEAFVRRCGIPYALMSGNSQEVLESEQGKRWLSAGNANAFLKALGDIIADLRDDLDRDVQAACKGADAIIAHPLCQDRGLIMAEALQIPVMVATLFPFFRTGAFAHPFVTTSRLPFAWMNRATHDLFERIWWQGQRHSMSDFCRQVGLPPTSRSTAQRLRVRRDPVLHAFSEHVLPRPADWTGEHTVTGYWHLSDTLRQRLGEGTVPAGLAEWLSQGDAPIFLGFGSMPVEDPAAMLATTVELARRLDTRILIGAGWSRIAADTLPDNVRIVGAVDHGWLFPRCRAIVHHGGAGTTAASLTAGRPTLICSVFADQPFWGRRITDLGVGAHIPYSKLTPAKLETALRALLRPEVAQRAAVLGERLRAESGVDNAVLAIKQHFHRLS